MDTCGQAGPGSVGGRSPSMFEVPPPDGPIRTEVMLRVDSLPLQAARTKAAPATAIAEAKREITPDTSRCGIAESTPSVRGGGLL